MKKLLKTLGTIAFMAGFVWVTMTVIQLSKMM
jgi:hypothetical protein